MSGIKRLFLAVNVPPWLKDKISEELLPSVHKTSLKPVGKENLHLTLLFLGATPEENIPGINEKLKGISFEPFTVKLKGFSHFNARVLFIAAEKGADEIISLSRKINSALGKNEKCDAHLTVARNKGMQKKEFLEILDLLNKKGFEAEFEVISFELMESLLSKKGPEYSVVHAFSASSPKTSLSSSLGLV